LAATGGRKDPNTHPGTWKDADRSWAPAPPLTWGFFRVLQLPSRPRRATWNGHVDLIRMRSQVQVLAGPPSMTAGHSAAGAEPGASAAWLGRAGAAHPSPPASSLSLPGSPTRAAGSTITTDSGRASSPRWQPRGRCGNAPLRQAPWPGSAASDPRPARRPDLPGQRSSAAAAFRAQSGQVRGRPHGTQPLRREGCPAVPTCYPRATAG
jgi:hypothetical protein